MQQATSNEQFKNKGNVHLCLYIKLMKCIHEYIQQTNFLQQINFAYVFYYKVPLGCCDLFLCVVSLTMIATDTPCLLTNMEEHLWPK
jgi:hypothetical protein